MDLLCERLEFIDCSKDQLDNAMERGVVRQTLVQSSIEESKQEGPKVSEEFTIDSILTNLKEDKPLETKSSRKIKMQDSSQKLI